MQRLTLLRPTNFNLEIRKTKLYSFNLRNVNSKKFKGRNEDWSMKGIAINNVGIGKTSSYQRGSREWNFKFTMFPVTNHQQEFGRHFSSEINEVRNEENRRRTTIYGLSTGIGKAAISIIRISGPNSFKGLSSLLLNQEFPKPRYASFRKLFHPKTNELIDSGIVLCFPSPHSYTGEDLVELQVHGSKAVVQDLLNCLSCLPSFRNADPGEFTKRAFFNGKLDLTQVEGLADLLASETEAQRKQALRQIGGDLSKQYQLWIDELKKALAYLEAYIDFGEDEELDPKIVSSVSAQIEKVKKEIIQHLDDGRRGERLRSGLNICIVGPPNAGKSSLLNLLVRRKASIVSPIPGTTRDVVEAVTDIGGYPVVLGDTAGLRVTNDIIETEGILLAKERFSSSDLKLCVFDIQEFPNKLEDQLTLQLVDQDTILIFNKLDLSSNFSLSSDLNKKIQEFLPKSYAPKYVLLSCVDGKGVPELLKLLETEIKSKFENTFQDVPLLTRARHRELLQFCLESLISFQENKNDILIQAEELRNAVRNLGKIIGIVGVEDLLDIIFADFCIGK